MLDEPATGSPKRTATFFFASELGGTEFARTMGAPGEQVAGLEIPPVGDALEVLRTLVR